MKLHRTRSCDPWSPWRQRVQHSFQVENYPPRCRCYMWSWCFFPRAHCWWFRNPVNSPVEVGVVCLSHNLRGFFFTSQVVGNGISEPSTVCLWDVPCWGPLFLRILSDLSWWLFLLRLKRSEVVICFTLMFDEQVGVWTMRFLSL